MRDLLVTIWTKVVKIYQQQEGSGKLTDKIFVRRIAVGIISIVFCLSAMGFSAYAFFTSNVTSAKNTLTAATYEVSATIKEKGNAGAEVGPIQGTTNVYMLNAENTYEVQLTAEGNTQNGYCKIEILDGVDIVETYYTKPLSPNSQMTFDITCYQAGTIRITSNWGSYSGYVGNLPQEGETEKLLFKMKDSVWSNAFAIGETQTTHVVGKEEPAQGQSQHDNEAQNSELPQAEEVQVVEPTEEEPTEEQLQGEETANAEE